MLKSLTVSNFALLEHVSVEFTEGLNILTGETGAGKSILIDALGNILGNRASTDSIRTGCEYFRIEAVFDISGCSQIMSLLDDLGIPVDEDQLLIVNRRLSRQGKNVILVNGSQIMLNVLRQIGEKLVDMHGQHEHQALLRPESYLALLDAYDTNIKTKLQYYWEIYQSWLGVNQELANAERDSRERAQRMDMLTWQTQEIAAAALTAGEDADLEQEIRVFSNAEKIASAVNSAYTLINNGVNGVGGVLPAFADIRRDLETASRYDQRLEQYVSSVADILYQMEDVSTALRQYADNIDFDPNHLAKLQERMDVIHKLKKKYGVTIQDVLDYYQRAVDEISTITNYDQHIAELTSKQNSLHQELSVLTAELDAMRRKAARELAEEILGHLINLGMPKAMFQIDVTKTDQFAPNGSNEVTFLFSANAGEEPKLLYKVASGGELSRIALAIKTVCADRDDIKVIVFDEIDAGIGGQTAQMVAEKIAMVACQKQVLCITHLPQIACMAERHIYIEKKTDEANRTFTDVRILEKNERLSEIARMISGDNLTPLALDNAAQIIESALQKKDKWKKQA